MNYCPWCGAEIPNDLGDIWEKLLIEEYGIQDPSWNPDKIPPEFRSDEWWKKRGL